jgi:hypothetical protein
MCQNKVITCAVCSFLAIDILPICRPHAAHGCKVVTGRVGTLLENRICRREFSSWERMKTVIIMKYKNVAVQRE